MSNWEDTVMSVNQVGDIIGTFDPILFEALKAQVEISFKAGYEQRKGEVEMTTVSLADMCLKHRKAGIEEGLRKSTRDFLVYAQSGELDKRFQEIKQAGIREVVEEVSACKMRTDVHQEDGSVFVEEGDIVILKEYWQAQKTKWGIKDAVT